MACRSELRARSRKTLRRPDAPEPEPILVRDRRLAEQRAKLREEPPQRVVVVQVTEQLRCPGNASRAASSSSGSSSTTTTASGATFHTSRIRSIKPDFGPHPASTGKIASAGISRSARPSTSATRAGSFRVATPISTPARRQRGEQLLVQAVTLAGGVEAPRDVLGADLAGDAGPQRVVEIGDQPLPGCRAGDQRRQQRRDGRRVGHGVRKARAQLGLDVSPPRRRRALVEPLQTAHGDAAEPSQPLGETRHRATKSQLLSAALNRTLREQRRQRKRGRTDGDRLRAACACQLVFETLELECRSLDDVGDVGHAPPTQPAKSEPRIDLGPLDHDGDRVGGGACRRERCSPAGRRMCPGRPRRARGEASRSAPLRGTCADGAAQSRTPATQRTGRHCPLPDAAGSPTHRPASSGEDPRCQLTSR